MRSQKRRPRRPWPRLERCAARRTGCAPMPTAPSTAASGCWASGTATARIRPRTAPCTLASGSTTGGTASGALTLANGAGYEGEWRHDAPSGEGTATLVDGTTLQGPWYDGAPGGKLTMVRPNGDSYAGELRRKLSDSPPPRMDALESDPSLATAASAAAVLAAEAEAAGGGSGGSGSGGRGGSGGANGRTPVRGGTMARRGARAARVAARVRVSGARARRDELRRWGRLRRRLGGGQPHGFGTATYAGGGSYTGDWVRGEPMGEGAHPLRLGRLLPRRARGRQAQRRRPVHVRRRRDVRWRLVGRRVALEAADGARRRCTFAEGHRYEGPFVHGRLGGRGTITFRNGDRYDGLLDGFARHGEGTCSYVVGHSTYVARWATTFARAPAASGARRRDSLRGRVARRPSARRRLRVGADGSVEEGLFARGLLHGAGERRDGFGNWWRGVFVDGLLRGEGECEADGARYSGGFALGKFEGHGEITDPDGSSYVGGWSGGLRSGSGRLVTSDGTEYAGGWLGGKKHGRGVLTAPRPLADLDGERSQGVRRRVGRRPLRRRGPRGVPFGRRVRGLDASRQVPRRRRAAARRWLRARRPVHRRRGERTRAAAAADGRAIRGRLRRRARSGDGRVRLPERRQVHGRVARGGRHGHGEMAYARGGGYVGGWAVDTMEGRGELTLPDGRVARGVWSGGKLSGVATLQLPTGGEYVGEVERLRRWIASSRVGRGGPSPPPPPPPPLRSASRMDGRGGERRAGASASVDTADGGSSPLGGSHAGSPSLGDSITSPLRVATVASPVAAFGGGGAARPSPAYAPPRPRTAAVGGGDAADAARWRSGVRGRGAWGCPMGAAPPLYPDGGVYVGEMCAGAAPRRRPDALR